MRNRGASRREVPGIRGRFCLVLFVLAVPIGAANGDQSVSESYVLQQSTLDVSGRRIESDTYRLTASLGQEMTVGTSSSNTLVLQSGFWSFAGSGIVPVLTAVDRNDGDPSHVDLTWSGNNPPYDVYQGVDCADIFSYFLTSTTDNSLIDITPPPASLVCYRVLPSAPGPTQPAGTSPGGQRP